MKLLDNQLDKPSLAKFGEEACRLFVARDFRGLAERFGYALHGNLDEASAIEMDLQRCLSGRDFSSTEMESVTVRHFKPNDTGLIWLIECVLLFDKSVRVLVELIVAKNGEAHNLYLEDINAVA
jgi:hypothetical protein